VAKTLFARKTQPPLQLSRESGRHSGVTTIEALIFIRCDGNIIKQKSLLVAEPDLALLNSQSTRSTLVPVNR
jgi:hypothetical protein